jgi:hypothetical protein
MRFLALPLALVAFHGSVKPLPAPLRAQLVQVRQYHSGCPVTLSRLRLLTVTYRGFDGRAHDGRLVVNATAAWPLYRVFHRLYRIGFAIRRMQPVAPTGDDTAAFDCRDAAPSPCPGSSPTHAWSMHAFGLAVDVNPTENPYTGCGITRDPAARRYLDRSRVRRGMVTQRAVAAFASIGWGWGGSWAGTKDYMHFSANGH